MIAGWRLFGTRGAAFHPPATTLEVVKLRIEADLSRLLDRKRSPFTAKNPDVPRMRSDTFQSSNPRRRSVCQAEARERGRWRTQVRVIGEAETVTLTGWNRGTSTIHSFVWDFAVPRYLGGKLVTQQQVTTRVKIKPGGEESVFEATCGPGFQNSSGLEGPTVLTR